MFPSLEQIRKEIKERNYAKILFNLSRKELYTAAVSFLEFLTLPSDFKNSFFAQYDPADHRSEVGYQRKKKINGSNDDKEFFHYHYMVEECLKPVIDGADEKTKQFLHHARKIYKEAGGLVKNLLDLFEVEYPGITAQFYDDIDKPRIFIRFLKYDAKGKGDFLARGHYDKGAFAIALSESAPGLRIGKNDKTIKEVEHEEHTTFFMPALYFSTLTDKEFTPAWHDVVQRSEDTFSDTVSRWAIVCFADAKGMDVPTEADTHTVKEY